MSFLLVHATLGVDLFNNASLWNLNDQPTVLQNMNKHVVLHLKLIVLHFMCLYFILLVYAVYLWYQQYSKTVFSIGLYVYIKEYKKYGYRMVISIIIMQESMAVVYMLKQAIALK